MIKKFWFTLLKSPFYLTFSIEPIKNLVKRFFKNASDKFDLLRIHEIANSDKVKL